MNASSQSVFLVTGAAGTLGRELVRGIVARGGDCIALDRNERGLNQLHDRLLEDGLPAPALYPMDLAGAGPDDYRDLAEAVEAGFGRLDTLIHAAAAFKALMPLEHQPAEEWFATLQCGLTGPFLLNSALMPLLRKSSRASIVLINNPVCLERPARWAAYGICQAGRRQMARTLAAELGPRGPAVLEICPEPFFSPLRSAAWPVENREDLPAAADAAAGILDQIQTGGHQ